MFVFLIIIYEREREMYSRDENKKSIYKKKRFRYIQQVNIRLFLFDHHCLTINQIERHYQSCKSTND
jgi:hypothetical protein